MKSSGGSMLPMIIGGGAVIGLGYVLWRKTHPVVDMEHRTNPLKDAAQAACQAAALASGLPPQLATLSCAVTGQILPGVAKGIAKGAKAVGKGVAKGAKAVGRGTKKVAKVAWKYAPPVLAVKGTIKGVKLVAKGTKKVGKAVAKGTKKVGKAVAKGTKKVVLAPVKGVKKIGKWLGLGDVDMDLASYAFTSSRRKRRPRRAPLPRFVGLSGAGCGPKANCCKTLRGQMRGHQFYEQGLSEYTGS